MLTAEAVHDWVGVMRAEYLEMPGLALTLVVVALGFVGDHLRDRLDPKAA